MNEWDMNQVIAALKLEYGAGTPQYINALKFFNDSSFSKQADYMGNFGVKPGVIDPTIGSITPSIAASQSGDGIPDYLKSTGGEDSPGGFMSFGMGGEDAIYEPGDTETSQLEDPGMTAAQKWGAAGGIIAGLAGIYGAREQSKQLNLKMKIRSEGLKMNKILADAQFNRKMSAHFQAHEDLQNKTTQMATNAAKEFRKKQADLQVIQAERGQAGQSSQDVHQTLLTGYHAYQQYVLAELERGEVGLMYQREGIIDERSAADAEYAVASASNYTQDVGAAMWASYNNASLDALDLYLKLSQI